MEATPLEHEEWTARRCATCGYDLRGQVEPRCPECGAAFDPAAGPLPPIPWIQSTRQSQWSAYWGTVAWVLRAPLPAGRTIAAAPGYIWRAAEGFRRVIARQASASVLALMMLMFVREIGSVTALVPSLFVGLVLLPGVGLFFHLATQPHSLPAWWWRHEPIAIDHADSLQTFAVAPLALLPLAPVLEAAALLCRLEQQIHAAHRLHQIAWTWVGGVLLAWWVYTLILMSVSRIWNAPTLTRAALWIPLRWLGFATLALAITLAVAACVVMPISCLVR